MCCSYCERRARKLNARIPKTDADPVNFHHLTNARYCATAVMFESLNRTYRPWFCNASGTKRIEAASRNFCDLLHYTDFFFFFSCPATGLNLSLCSYGYVMCELDVA